MPQEDPERIGVVVSMFAPPAELVERAVRWSEQIGPVVAVDDGSPRKQALPVLRALDAAGIHVLVNRYNAGIAHSLNAGVSWLREHHDPRWILTMDQDSDFGPDYGKQAMEALAAVDCPDQVGMICPESLDGVAVHRTEGPHGEREIFDPIQSGAFVRAAMIDRIGPLREDFFIDCVDSEFNARAREDGWLLLAGEGLDLHHSLGEARPMRLLGWHVRIPSRKLYVHSHAPFRVYYMTRNSLVMARRFARSQPRWVLRRVANEAVAHAVRFSYGPRRRANFLAFRRGFADGLRGRMGRIPTELEEALKR